MTVIQRCRNRALLIGALLATTAAASPISAQLPAGTVVMRIATKLPDSLRASPMGAMLPPALRAQITVTSDGKRVAADIEPQLSDSNPMTRGMALRLIYTVGSDSIHGGVLMPAMSAALNGASGIAVDFPISMFNDTAIKAAIPSMSRTDSTKSRVVKLGTRAHVGEWDCSQSLVITGADTVRMCSIPTPATIAPTLHLLRALAQLRGLVPSDAPLVDELPVRIEFAEGTMELVRASANVNETLLTLPPGLQSFKGMGELHQ